MKKDIRHLVSGSWFFAISASIMILLMYAILVVFNYIAFTGSGFTMILGTIGLLYVVAIGMSLYQKIIK